MMKQLEKKLDGKKISSQKIKNCEIEKGPKFPRLGNAMKYMKQHTGRDQGT